MICILNMYYKRYTFVHLLVIYFSRILLRQIDNNLVNWIRYNIFQSEYVINYPTNRGVCGTQKQHGPLADWGSLSSWDFLSVISDRVDSSAGNVFTDSFTDDGDGVSGVGDGGGGGGISWIDGDASARVCSALLGSSEISAPPTRRTWLYVFVELILRAIIIVDLWRFNILFNDFRRSLMARPEGWKRMFLGLKREISFFPQLTALGCV